VLQRVLQEFLVDSSASKTLGQMGVHFLVLQLVLDDIISRASHSFLLVLFYGLCSCEEIECAICSNYKVVVSYTRNSP